MLRFLALFLIIMVQSLAFAQTAITPVSADTATVDSTAAEPVFTDADYCYDQDKFYKRCQDQNLRYEQAKAAALQQNKQLLVVYGYEGCEWCDNIVKVLYFSDYAAEIQKKFVIVSVAKSDFFPSGKELVALLRKQFVQPKMSGVPYLVLVNPVSGAGTFIDLLSFERNLPETENLPGYNGYYVEKVVEAIRKSSAQIK